MSQRNHRRIQHFPVKPVAAALFSLTIAGGASLAHAQALEEVIVTAQKQAESLQAVPISIQAFDAKALETGGVTSVFDIKTVAPAVSIKNFPVASEDLLITMRGVPVTNINIFNDPPTSINIDGIYIARNSGLNMTVADLAGVEVLKGPQGTLYGRNAISGAVNFTTQRPSTDALSFSEALTIGNYNRLVSKTSVNVPLTSNFAAKLAYVHDQSDGFVGDSNGSGQHWGDRKADAGRLDFRWKPSDRVTVDYGYDWNTTDAIPWANQCLSNLSSNPGSKAKPINGSGGPLVGMGYINVGCTSTYQSALPMPNGPVLFMPPKNHWDNTGHMLKVEWEVSSTLTFRSLTGYR